MLEQYNAEIEKLAEWHDKTKGVVIDAESLDIKGNTYMQPMNEQRYSYDHFVRAITYESNNDSGEKVKNALTSAIGHLQRAYSDSVEWMLVSISQEYQDTLKDFSKEQIDEGFPEYYSKIRPSLKEMTDLVNEYKKGKRIEQIEDSVEMTEQQATFFNNFSNQFYSDDFVQILKRHLSSLHNHEQELIQISKRDSKKNIKDKVIIPIVTAFISATASGVLVAIIMNALK